jgi:hypothetical protein
MAKRRNPKDKPAPALDADTLRAFEEAARRLVRAKPEAPRKGDTKTRRGKRS